MMPNSCLASSESLEVTTMASPMPIDGADSHNSGKRRRLRRKQTSNRGRLVYGAENFHVDCIIRDFNESGARVWVDDIQSVPDSVTLLEPSNLNAYDATTVWRCGNLIGLSFDRAFSVDDEEVIRMTTLRQLMLEMRDQSTADDTVQSVTSP